MVVMQLSINLHWTKIYIIVKLYISLSNYTHREWGSYTYKVGTMQFSKFTYCAFEEGALETHFWLLIRVSWFFRRNCAIYGFLAFNCLQNASEIPSSYSTLLFLKSFRHNYCIPNAFIGYNIIHEDMHVQYLSIIICWQEELKIWLHAFLAPCSFLHME